MDMCLRVLKESNNRRFYSYSVRNSVLIISHITFRDCRKHIFSDHLSRNSCKCQARKCFPPLLLSRDRLASLTNNGVNGHNGLPGRDGRDGAKRENCVVGPPGPRRERNGTKRNSHLSQKLETVRVEEQRRSWHVLKIRRPVYKRLFKSRAMCYQKGDVNQTCQQSVGSRQSELASKS